ncbi:hypothetical protein NKF26_23465 [Haladaptatus sp. AB618]|uniref:hypothetical protein n=1 Tax=Haladaptatus sp. AB618 TaxID=2934173 RepID=UPI00209BFD5A|nr:hypothetical protein [Haladaptatus sp. AB618]MCO8256784.1 hypothetical protein [Haladaptatus sp. AB618]
MTKVSKPRTACQDQVELYDTLRDPGLRPILAVELGKAKFNQLKALNEFHMGMESLQSVPEDTATRSAKMVKARDGDSVPAFSALDDDKSVETADSGDDEVSSMPQNKVAEVWERIANGERWIGAVPVSFYREMEDVYLVGRPFLMGFNRGQPRVILNQILPRAGGNMGRIYANEWARPWVIAKILDASGFNMDQTSLVTMKAQEPGSADEDSVLGYLPGNARKTVDELMAYRANHDLRPDRTAKPSLSHEPPYVQTEVLGYDTEFSLYDRIGFGDSIKDIIAVFQGEQGPRQDDTPDKGLSLEYALKHKF